MVDGEYILDLEGFSSCDNRLQTVKAVIEDIMQLKGGTKHQTPVFSP